MRIWLPWSFLLLTVAVLAVGFDAVADDAACRIPETGLWLNPNATTKQIHRIEIASHCERGRIVVKARAFTKCSPRDCKWGWTEAFRSDNGRLNADFTGFFGSRRIEMIPMGDRMEVLVTTDPHTHAPSQFHSALMQRD